MKVLAIGAHPDDIEINCAGTLARFAAAGDAVELAVFTSGNMGDLHAPPAELAATRRAEAEASAALLGARLHWVGVDDECVFPNETQRALMIDLLRAADPDLIITHAPNDYHPDHRYVSQLVFDSYFQKGLPHVPGPSRPACRFGGAHVYFMDNLGGIGFEPMEYVDITEVFELKRRMLACHASQVRPMLELAGTDMMQMIEVQGRFRGMAAGCAIAEGFRRLEAFQRGLCRRVLP